MYKLNGINSVTRQSDGMNISIGNGTPEDIEYKQWLSEGNTPEPEFSQEELDIQKQAVLKQAKANKLNTIVVDVDGIALDGNEVARANMMSTIMSAEIIGQTESPWKLADNTVEIVTIFELKQALALSIQEVGRIVMVTSIEEL